MYCEVGFRTVMGAPPIHPFVYLSVCLSIRPSVLGSRARTGCSLLCLASKPGSSQQPWDLDFLLAAPVSGNRQQMFVKTPLVITILFSLLYELKHWGGSGRVCSEPVASLVLMTWYVWSSPAPAVPASRRPAPSPPSPRAAVRPREPLSSPAPTIPMSRRPAPSLLSLQATVQSSTFLCQASHGPAQRDPAFRRCQC